MNRPETHGTIPTVSYFVDKPSEQPVFATATPSAPTRALRRDGASTSDYAAQTGPSSPPITSRCLPRRKPKAMGGKAANGVAILSFIHDVPVSQGIENINELKNGHQRLTLNLPDVVD